MFMYLNKCLAATPPFTTFSDWASILQSMAHDASPPLCCWTLENDLEIAAMMNIWPSTLDDPLDAVEIFSGVKSIV